MTRPRILVLDEDSDGRAFVRQELGKLGASSISVSSTAAALNALKRHRFDALIADLRPTDNGASEVVWWSVLNGLPTAVLAAEPDEARAWLSGEGIEVIEKPARSEDLVRLLSRANRQPHLRTG